MRQADHSHLDVLRVWSRWVVFMIWCSCVVSPAAALPPFSYIVDHSNSRAAILFLTTASRSFTVCFLLMAKSRVGCHGDGAWFVFVIHDFSFYCSRLVHVWITGVDFFFLRMQLDILFWKITSSAAWSALCTFTWFPKNRLIPSTWFYCGAKTPTIPQCFFIAVMMQLAWASLPVRSQGRCSTAWNRKWIESLSLEYK